MEVTILSIIHMLVISSEVRSLTTCCHATSDLVRIYHLVQHGVPYVLGKYGGIQLPQNGVHCGELVLLSLWLPQSHKPSA